MRAFKQGSLDRFCSIYAVLNACNFMGLKLKKSEMQDFYDDVVERLIEQGQFGEIALYGADNKRLELVMKSADRFLSENYGLKLCFVRPFWNQRFEIAKLCGYVSLHTSENKAVITRVRSNDFDHWSVVKGIYSTQIQFFDSDDMAKIQLNEISPVYKEAKHQICIRNLYCLELVKL